MRAQAEGRPAIPALGTSWAAAAQVFAGVVAGGLAFFLAGVPVQVSDSLGNLMSVAGTSWPDLLRDQFFSRSFFRPLLLAQTKLLLDLSAGHYVLAFRGFQIVQVFACFWLFVRMLRVRSPVAFAAAAVATAALAGSHGFAGTIREAYPINNYLTVALCALVAVNVQMEGRTRWWSDVLVVGSLVVALGTIETGLLVWGCLFIGFLAGWRGVSRPALAAATLVVVAYFGARFWVLDVGMPGLIERSSGFGFARLEPSELEARFGAEPWRFYLYNVFSSLSTVLFSEPRAGVWIAVRDWQSGELNPAVCINVVASVVSTTLIMWFVFRQHWRRRPSTWSHGQRLVLLAAAVAVANAGISFPYTKDQIMSVAAIFYAAALFAAVHDLFCTPPRALAARAVTVLLVLTISATWSWRALGLQHSLLHTAFTQRNDWAYTDMWIKEHPESQRDPRLAHIVESLRVAALRHRVPNPHTAPSRFEEFFDHHTD